ncbi:MAG: hypothetical protein RMK30_05115 [Anaerolineae bacterium]|nr:hypothetical protein [Anaerolineae bacterium]MDW8102237.1 hypothetical protein [Anaerolineae bacterium]
MPLLSALVAVTCWLCLFLLVNLYWPTPFTFQLFLFLLFMAVFSTVTPFYHSIGMRFPFLQRRKGLWPPVRRGFLTALLFSSFAFLKAFTALTIAVALLLAGMLLILELYFSIFVD